MNRLDYGTRYCPDSPSIEEKTLQDAIVRAIIKFQNENSETYLALLRATVSEAFGLKGSSDEIDLLERRVDALNKRMLELVSENVKNGGSFESSEGEFKEINDQIRQLKDRIEAIQKSMSSDEVYREKLEMVNREISEHQSSCEYSDSIVRHMIECIKVFSDGRLEVYFGGGNMVEEHI